MTALFTTILLRKLLYIGSAAILIYSITRLVGPRRKEMSKPYFWTLLGAVVIAIPIFGWFVGHDLGVW